MAFTKSTLTSLFLIAAVGSVSVTAQSTNCFSGEGESFVFVTILDLIRLLVVVPCLLMRIPELNRTFSLDILLPATNFNRSALPADFTPCGGNCPPPSPSTLPIALPSDFFKGADSCCSTFTITFDGNTVQGTYAYKSSNLAGTRIVALDNDLYAQLGGNPNDPSGGLFPVQFCL
ncbi:hypothetical protein D9758_014025 [Tetrapyrgos nigripes]|uniref:Uncharacterized protein n=1 Tax=Tetrapyrgos nigripes TaxID=182062 RepID=A0A8H5FV53_9AGAR|nr:hypothetical protein D9758_014025 [Tetrapyrgos nigripes]